MLMQRSILLFLIYQQIQDMLYIKYVLTSVYIVVNTSLLTCINILHLITVPTILCL